MIRQVSALATMHPANFALVLATGIVSIACLLGLGLAAPLVYGSTSAATSLWILTALRSRASASRGGRPVSSRPLVGFHDCGSDVCPRQSADRRGKRASAALFWFAGILLWALVTYTVFRC
jgi:hypothetical protein